MRAERDLGFGPSNRQGKIRSTREAEAAPSRGDREATLVRRRRMQRVRRVALPVIVALLAISTLIGWYSGVIPQSVDKFTEQTNDQIAKAGLVIDEVEVSGFHHLTRADILEAVAVPPGTPIFNVNIDEVRNRVAIIGWVKSVAVSRELPNRLLVQVVEREPIAVWQQGGLLALIDKDGVVITTAGIAEFSSLPQVVGVGAERAAARLVPVLRSEPILYKDIQAAVRIADRRWDILFKNGIRARLPDSGEAQAWKRLAGLQASHHILSREIQIVDLRQSDRFILRLTPDEIKRRKVEKAAGVKGGNV